jgi:nucleoside-diphosphate-sugar epimerase
MEALLESISNRIRGKEVLIIGGIGMIGSTIARKLVKYGARVTLMDACIEPYGANFFNTDEIRDIITLNISDIRDKESIKILVRNKDVIFNLAAQVSHNDSIENPFLDADINYIGHLNVLEALRNYNTKAVILHSGSRLQFGRNESVPVGENHPLKPRTPYALNKTAAENSYFFYQEMYGINCVVFRIANPYGPRSQMKHSKYSMINWFLRQVMENRSIKIFGDGSQIRDYIYVDDLADAFIAASVNEKCYGHAFNVGSGRGTRFSEMAETIVNVAKRGNVEYVPWPEDYVNVETGDYITDIGKICSFLDWQPMTDLKTGIERTFEYYRKYKSHYW